MTTDDEAQTLIEALQLAPHPEGGWYRETFRAETRGGERSAMTAIYFLLGAGQRSHWHRVDATEVWAWHAGSPLLLSTAADERAAVRPVRLGPDIVAGERPQHVIAAHHWQAAEACSGWALVSCLVAPGFQFEGFELAAPGWAPSP